MSLYEASDIVPGASFRARDLIRGGEPVLVSEHTATRMLKPWDRIAGRIVPQGPRMVLSGGLLSFTLEASQALFAQLRDRYAHVIRGARIAAPSLDALAGWAGTDADLQRAAPLFTTAWLFDMLLRALGINRPTVVNSDGDEVVFHTVTFSIRLGASREEIARRLGGVRELQQESGTFWNWVAQTSLRPAKPRGAESGARAAIWNITTEDGGVVLGNVELKPRTVVLSVSSAARAEGGKDILSATLADLVGPPRIEIRTVEQMLAEARPDRKKAAARIPREVETGLVHAALDRQYRALLDEPVPMLGNMSPRAAARSAQGRKNVAAWLKHLENSSGNTTDQSDPVATYDSPGYGRSSTLSGCEIDNAEVRRPSNPAAAHQRRGPAWRPAPSQPAPSQPAPVATANVAARPRRTANVTAPLAARRPNPRPNQSQPMITA